VVDLCVWSWCLFAGADVGRMSGHGVGGRGVGKLLTVGGPGWGRLNLQNLNFFA